MFLKQLDIVGFKSFASRTRIEFVPGVTAVVGPNGSGKSNISDAIRWVLGEQSAKSLRGGKMEDIIFSGSDAKKALNVAEVTLTLNNEDHYLPYDYTEISVTRRIYRSGESEYLLNKQPCRLKDIVDLFMDSGLGRESYSVIGQGKIDEILNSRAEDKRVIFEEAAGVLKYKTRKTKAEKKLTETVENLERVDDILKELQEQVEPLKIQASVARDYLQKQQDLEEIEGGLLVHEIEDFHARWTALTQQVKDHEQEELRLSAVINEEDATIEKQRSELGAHDAALDEKHQSLLSISEGLEKLEGQREVLKERQKNTRQSREQLKQSLHTYKEKITQNETDIDKRRTEWRGAHGQLQQAEKELDDESQKMEAQGQDTEAELERLKGDYIEVMNDQATLRNETRNLEERRAQLEAKSARLDGEYQKYIQSRNDMNERKTRLQHEIEEGEVRLEQGRQAYRRVQDEIKEQAEDLQNTETSLAKARRELDQLQSRKQVLEAMQEDRAGFYNGVKEILKANLPGLDGAVAELLRVPKDYETALETALGGAMQHVVTENEKHARDAIAHLKKTGKGRATFLPLSTVKPRHLKDSDLRTIREHKALIGIAFELVSCDNHYINVIENLLGNVIVARDLQGANDIAAQLKHRFRIVTLDGDIVNPGGSMAGGSRKPQKNSLLARQRELEQIKEKLETVENRAVTLDEEAGALKQTQEDKQNELEELRKQGESLRLAQQKSDGNMRELEIEEKNINERLTLYDREKDEYSEEMANIDQHLQELAANLKKAVSSEKHLDDQINQLTQKKEKQEETKATTQSAITDLKVKVAECEQRVGHLKESIDQLIQEKKSNEKERDALEEQFWQLEEEQSGHTGGEEELDAQIDAKRKEKDGLQQGIQERRDQRADLQQQIEDREHELKETKRQHKQQAAQLHDEEVKKNRLDVELDNRLTTLRQDYELSYEAATEKYSLTMDVEKARQQVKLIKRAIDELGTVNLGAIEEYDRVSERINFLNEQKDDLLQARQNLLDVIREMDKEVVQRFEETFTAVRGQFREVFRELFGGGQADLQLTDPDDLLHSGVEVLAQPPGKKLQHMALLSGGERALTAITLLFAILKVRPVPFSVLDEVEAALDEANVSRFAQYLKHFSKETQFVVVTHRKSTMEEADVLYGVTMQQSGISNLVSVRLEESKQLVES